MSGIPGRRERTVAGQFCQSDSIGNRPICGEPGGHPRNLPTGINYIWMRSFATPGPEFVGLVYYYICQMVFLAVPTHARARRWGGPPSGLGRGILGRCQKLHYLGPPHAASSETSRSHALGNAGLGEGIRESSKQQHLDTFGQMTDMLRPISIATKQQHIAEGASREIGDGGTSPPPLGQEPRVIPAATSRSESSYMQQTVPG